MNQNEKNAFSPLFNFFKFKLKAGFFKDSRGFEAGDSKGTYGGGTVRTKSKIRREKSTYEIIDSLRFSGRDILNTPLQKTSKELKTCVDHVAKFGKKDSSWIKRAVNLAKAILLVPMLEGKYKKEKESTIKIKGFSRPTIDTGQTAKQIEARYFATGVDNKG